MSNLKYDFINEDHKRMHDALLRTGWSCENDYKSWNWVYKKDKESIYFDNLIYDICHRDANNVKLIFYKKSFAEIADILEQEIKDIQPKDFSHIKPGQWIKSLVTDNDIQKDKWYQVKSTSQDILQYINNEGDCITCWSVEEWDINDVRDNNPDDNTIESNVYHSLEFGSHTDYINTDENIANRFMQIFKLAELQDKEFAEFVKNNNSNTYNYVDMYFDFLSIDRGVK